MPNHNDLQISVVNQFGEPLQEWGKQVTHGQKNFVSCYIQSETGMSFRIEITPSEQLLRRIGDQILLEEDRQFRKNGRRYPDRDARRVTAPYHFLATLRLDGRRTPEKRNIIYLDSMNEWFHRPHGTVTMIGKTMRDSDDSDVKFHKWVFQEIGIESMLDDLSLAFDSKDIEPEEDPLVQAMKGLGDNYLEDKEEVAKAGTIEIIIERVTVAEKTYRREWKPEQFYEEHARAAFGRDNNISHTTGIDAGTKISKDAEFITYHPLDEQPHATFKFFYRGEDVLRKFGFHGFTQKKEIKPDLVAMSNLGIGEAETPGKRSIYDSDGESSDEGSPSRRKIKSSKKSPKKPKFAAQLHDVSNDSEEEDEEIEKLRSQAQSLRGVDPQPDWLALRKKEAETTAEFGKPIWAKKEAKGKDEEEEEAAQQESAEIDKEKTAASSGDVEQWAS